VGIFAEKYRRVYKSRLKAYGEGHKEGQKDILTTEAQQGDAEMGRDADAARKAKKN
jgi:hypothetical protein